MFWRKRDAEACETQPHLHWDSIWIQRLDSSGGYADWILASEGDQADSLGGLRSEQSLHTATMLCLFTNARLPDDQTPDDDGYRGGWWGNSIKLDDEPDEEIGSLLWTLRRSPLTERTAKRAKDICDDALAIIAKQGAVARTVVETELRPSQGLLGIIVRHFDRDGSERYEQRFGVLWEQVAGGAPMNYGDRGVFERAV